MAWRLPSESAMEQKLEHKLPELQVFALTVFSIPKQAELKELQTTLVNSWNPTNKRSKPQSTGAEGCVAGVKLRALLPVALGCSPGGRMEDTVTCPWAGGCSETNDEAVLGCKRAAASWTCRCHRGFGLTRSGLSPLVPHLSVSVLRVPHTVGRGAL